MEECPYVYHPVPESGLQSSCGVTAQGSGAAGESLQVSLGDGPWEIGQGQPLGTVRVFRTLMVVRAHSAPCSPRSHLLGIRQGPASSGSLESRTCLDLNPSSAQTRSGSQLVNIYVASIAQALGLGYSGNKQDRCSPCP